MFFSTQAALDWCTTHAVPQPPDMQVSFRRDRLGVSSAWVGNFHDSRLGSHEYEVVLVTSNSRNLASAGGREPGSPYRWLRIQGMGRGRVRIQVHCISGPYHPPQVGGGSVCEFEGLLN